MIQFIADLLHLIEEVRHLNLSEAQFRATLNGCILSMEQSRDLTDEQKIIASMILSDVKY